MDGNIIIIIQYNIIRKTKCNRFNLVISILILINKVNVQYNK